MHQLSKHIRKYIASESDELSTSEICITVATMGLLPFLLRGLKENLRFRDSAVEL